MREFWYRLLRSPEGTQDGSSKVNHQIESVYSDDGGTTRLTTPGYHKTVSLDSSDVQTVMDMPDSTGLERAAKNAAYKNLIALHIEDGPYSPPTKLWDDASMLLYTEANDDALLEAGRMDFYITDTLGVGYPADFHL